MWGEERETDDAAADLLFPSLHPGLPMMTGVNAEQLIPSTTPKLIGKRPAEAANKGGDGSALKKLKKSRCAAYRKLLGQNVKCRIEGCEEACQSSYCARSKLCKTHMKALEVDYKGVKSRFCHKCTKFEPVEAFTRDNHTCNAWLQKARVRYSSNHLATREAKAELLCKTINQTEQASSCASIPVATQLGDGMANVVRHMTKSSSNDVFDLFADEFAAIQNNAVAHDSEPLWLPGSAVSVGREPQMSAGMSDAGSYAAGVQWEFRATGVKQQTGQASSCAGIPDATQLGNGMANVVRHMTKSSSNDVFDLFADEFAAIQNNAAAHDSEPLRLPGSAVSVGREPQMSAGMSDAGASAAGVQWEFPATGVKQNIPQPFPTRQFNHFSQPEFDDGSHMSPLRDDCQNLERDWTLQWQLEQQRRRWQQEERQQMQQEMSSFMNNIGARHHEMKVQQIRRQLQLQWEQRQLLLKKLQEVQEDQSQDRQLWEQFQ